MALNVIQSVRPRYASRGRQNLQTLVACTVIGTLCVGVTLALLMQDTERVLPVAAAVQAAPPAKVVDRGLSTYGPVVGEPQEQDCGNFAFFFLNPTCGKARARHAVHIHRVATFTTTANASAANQQPPVTTNGPRDTANKTISSPPGDAVAAQSKLHTAMRVIPQ